MARQLFLLTAFFCASISAAAEGITDYYGLWWNEDRSGIFELQAADGNSIEGITRWGKGQDKDVNNPDPALRTRDLKGISFLYGFEYVAKKNRWKDGKVYDPGNGKTYSAKMELEDGGTTLKMRGYIGISLLGRTARFERVSDVDMPEELRAELAAN